MPASRVTPSLNPNVRVDSDTAPEVITNTVPQNVPFFDWEPPIGVYQVWMRGQVQASVPGTRVRMDIVQGLANTPVDGARAEQTAPAVSFPMFVMGTVEVLTTPTRIALGLSSDAGDVTITNRALFFMRLGNEA